ncbi:rRNA methyltransferase 3, mitochondrial-like [Panonychus citri]|uniref:rRNA methyltransferase 3, mitochondrial-like n=1 Tax=Panonychus citri TaxID=50023 RepID=UPI0023077CD0|nr:rRNA methyltransferase 3, mitochondrial-like [Panonychus citri]
MLSSSIRGHVCSIKPLIRLSIAAAGGDSGARPIIKILDSEGNPYYPVPEISSEKVPRKVIESFDKKRFNPKSYATYIKHLSMKDAKSCRFDNRFTYVNISHDHPDFVRAKLIIRGLTGERKSFIALEGKNIVRDGLQCGLKLDKLFFTKESILQGIPELETLLTAAYMGEYKDHGPVLIKVTPNMMNRLSDVQTPPGIIGLFAKPTSSSESSATRNCGIPVTLIGDNIRDPGNMGTLIRSSASIGVERIICTSTANPWESKVVRSGAGAHFRCNLITDFEWSTLPTLLPPKDSTLIFAEKTKSQTNELTSSSTLSSKNYFDLDYPQFIDSDKKLAVIIGGETEGISDEALALTNLYQRSYKVNIPILKGIDSLNSAIAGSIILFEIQRQIIKGIAK